VSYLTHVFAALLDLSFIPSRIRFTLTCTTTAPLGSKDHYVRYAIKCNRYCIHFFWFETKLDNKIINMQSPIRRLCYRCAWHILLYFPEQGRVAFSHFQRSDTKSGPTTPARGYQPKYGSSDQNFIVAAM
jgi:hypothetical protein